MSDIAIKLENISKQYRLGTVGTGSLKADIQAWWYRMRGKEDKTLQIGQENSLADAGGDYVWALRDINLEVKKGEILGIIGKNGAGKSTLLKLLSRVTGPTTGQIKINGRIASLLEVGTGFHGELTGRENIFLNGSILGMTKKEIQKELDNIVEFAGIAKYIDTPVKRYSSGMYVRLGFAVAAHLNPDILIVDEVLAVGDAEFQKKAIGKMKEVSAGGGRTVLFVSHNMASVKTLCSKAILLENGRIVDTGTTENVISKYLTGNSGMKNFKKGIDKPLVSLPEIDLFEIGVKAKTKKYQDIITLGDEIEFTAKINHKKDKSSLNLTIHLKDELGNVIFTTGSGSVLDYQNQKGKYKVSVIFPSHFFNWGNISIDIFLVETGGKGVLYVERDIIAFSIVNNKKEIGQWMGKEAGAIHPRFNWYKETI